MPASGAEKTFTVSHISVQLFSCEAMVPTGQCSTKW